MSLAKRLLLAGAIALACSQPVLAETVGQTLEQADRYWVEGKLVQAQQAVEGRGRAFLRASGTEPVVRVTVEADDAALVESTLAKLADAVRFAAS